MEISPMDHVAVDVLEDDGTMGCTGGLDKSLLKDDAGTSITEKLKTKMDARLTVLSTDGCPTIYRVPNILRKLDQNAYEPQVISLGPYHHGKPHLKSMDEIKWQYLNSFLSRNPRVGLDRYVCRVKDLKTQIRNAYSEAPPCEEAKDHQFIEMMLLDACFVLEFLFYSVPTACHNRWETAFVYMDMIRLENQIPFFLLKELLQLNRPNAIPSLTKAIYDVFWDLMPGKIRIPSVDLDHYHHILHLLVSCAAPDQSAEAKQPQSAEAKQPQLTKEKQPRSAKARQPQSAKAKQPQSAKAKQPRSAKAKQPQSAKAKQPPVEGTAESSRPREPTLEWIPCARRLDELGVVLRKKEVSKYESFLDITFEQGTMEIPPLQIFRDIETVFRNLIAFEQCFSAVHKREDGLHVTAYTCLMDFIIGTPKDVEKLDGIIVSTLGNDREIARLFNRLCVHLPFDSESYLSGVYKRIDEYGKQGWHEWMATLRHNYFSNPWAWISVLAAILLFLLTIMQTILSFLSYLHPI